jgi:hypothetical protein
MLSNGYKVSSSSAALAIVCFFLPWVMVSCSGQPLLSLSGWDLAAGKTLETGFGSEKMPGEPLMFLALLPGLAVFGLAYLTSVRGKLSFFDKVGLVVLGVL